MNKIKKIVIILSFLLMITVVGLYAEGIELKLPSVSPADLASEISSLTTTYLKLNAQAELDMGEYNISGTTITARDSDGLYLLDDGNKGIFIKDGGFVGINTTEPTSRLEIYDNTYLLITGKVISNQAPERAMFVGAKARGTLATPLAVQSGDYLLSFFGQGYDGSGYKTSPQVEFKANQNWTGAAHGSYIVFNTVDNGTTLIDERLRIDHNGNIGINTTSPSTKFEVKNGSITISGTNANLIVGGDATISGIVYSTAVYSQDSDLLDGNDSLYYAIRADVATDTATIQGNLDTEVIDRASEDNLISDATGQIRTDFEAYDALLNTSTGTLRTDLGIAETAITNLETSTSTLEGYVFDLWASTATLEADLATEISDRISEDDLISDATGQIRTDFEAYDALLNTSTGTLRTDLNSEIAIRLNTSYAHGYDTDVVVAVTGSTETFIIIESTWISSVTSNGFTISGASCTYNGVGGSPKIFKVSGAFSAISDTVNTTVYWALFKNGVLYPSSIINRKIAIQGDVGAMSISTLVELSTGDILDIRLSGDESAIITNSFVQFDIIQIN